MSSARLDVIADDDAMAPRMSRTLPAALYGIVDTVVFQAFCDRMDKLFEQLDADQRRRKNRFWWISIAVYFWLLMFVFTTPILSDFLDAHGLSETFYALSVLLPFPLCIIHVCVIWGWTARPTGAKTDAEAMCDIRSECDEMSNRSQMVSYQVVLMPVPASARGAWMQMNTVDHIEVSISASATAASANVPNVLLHNGKVDIAAENHKPVTCAKAVENGDYQQLV